MVAIRKRKRGEDALKAGTKVRACIINYGRILIFLPATAHLKGG